jgi:DNA-binding SARP family transcriptional activator
VLGGFAWLSDGTEIPVTPAGQRLIALLSVRRRPLPRAVVAGTLWPESSEARAAASLRTELWKLSKDESPICSTTSGLLVLDPAVTCDLHDAIDFAHRLIDGVCCPTMGVVEDLLLDDLIPDWTDDWIAVERVRFHQLRLHALEALIDGYVREGRFASAVEIGLVAVEADPFRETSRRALIGAYLSEGNTRDAVDEYRAFKALLADELGAEPSDALRSMLASAATHLAVLTVATLTLS